MSERQSEFGRSSGKTRPPAHRRRLGAAGWTAIGVLAALALAAAGATAFVRLAWLADVPPVPPAEQLWSYGRTPGVTFLDRTGAKIAVRGPNHGSRVTLAGLAAYVPRAFLAAEDRRFYRHGPVDWWGTVRAALANGRAGQVVQGGSSLTQQLAKTLFLKPDQTLKRKAQEAASRP